MIMRMPYRSISMTRSVYVTATLATLIGIVACAEDSTSTGSTTSTGGTSTTSQGGGTSTGSGGTTTTTAAAVGTFSITLTPANSATGTDAYAALKGMVRTGPLPAPKAWTVQASGNGCELLIPSTPLCD